MNLLAYLSIATIFISHSTYASQAVVRGASSLLPALRSSTGVLLRPGTAAYGLAYTRQLGTSIPQPGARDLVSLFKQKVTPQSMAALNKPLGPNDFIKLAARLIDEQRAQVAQKTCAAIRAAQVAAAAANPVLQKSIHSLFNPEAEQAVRATVHATIDAQIAKNISLLEPIKYIKEYFPKIQNLAKETLDLTEKRKKIFDELSPTSDVIVELPMGMGTVSWKDLRQAIRSRLTPIDWLYLPSSAPASFKTKIVYSDELYEKWSELMNSLQPYDPSKASTNNIYIKMIKLYQSFSQKNLDPFFREYANAYLIDKAIGNELRNLLTSLEGGANNLYRVLGYYLRSDFTGSQRRGWLLREKLQRISMLHLLLQSNTDQVHLLQTIASSTFAQELYDEMNAFSTKLDNIPSNIHDFIAKIQALEAKAHEQKMAIFFHAQRRDVTGLAITNTRLAELLEAHPYEKNMLFRSLKQSESFSTPQEVIRAMQQNPVLTDNQHPIRDQVLSVNPSLTSHINYQGESSLYYFVSNRSIKENITPLYMQTCDAYGLSPEVAQKLAVLSGGDSAEPFGTLHVILIPKQHLAKTAYPATPWGLPALEETKQSKERFSVFFPVLNPAMSQEVAEQYQALEECKTARFYEAMHKLPQAFREPENLQFRVVMTKDVMANPNSGVEVHTLTINQEDLDRRKQEAIKLIDKAVAEKLAQDPHYLDGTPLGEMYQHFKATQLAAHNIVTTQIANQ